MTKKEIYYCEKFGKEYLTLKESCAIWVKPSYSYLSKKLANIGHKTAVNKKIIPIYKKVGNCYLFKIKDILDFIENDSRN